MYIYTCTDTKHMLYNIIILYKHILVLPHTNKDMSYLAHTRQPALTKCVKHNPTLSGHLAKNSRAWLNTLWGCNYASRHIHTHNVLVMEGVDI